MTHELPKLLRIKPILLFFLINLTFVGAAILEGMISVVCLLLRLEFLVPLTLSAIIFWVWLYWRWSSQVLYDLGAAINADPTALKWYKIVSWFCAGYFLSAAVIYLLGRWCTDWLIPLKILKTISVLMSIYGTLAFFGYGYLSYFLGQSIASLIKGSNQKSSNTIFFCALAWCFPIGIPILQFAIQQWAKGAKAQGFRFEDIFGSVKQKIF